MNESVVTDVEADMIQVPLALEEHRITRLQFVPPHPLKRFTQHQMGRTGQDDASLTAKQVDQ
ncbi:hypothetical protein D3C84_1211300 [compost metagenome]